MLLVCMWSLHTVFQPRLGRFSLLSPMKSFPIGVLSLEKASANSHYSLMSFWSTELQTSRPKQFNAFSYKHNIKMALIKLGSKDNIN